MIVYRCTTTMVVRTLTHPPYEVAIEGGRFYSSDELEHHLLPSKATPDKKEDDEEPLLFEAVEIQLPSIAALEGTVSQETLIQFANSIREWLASPEAKGMGYDPPLMPKSRPYPTPAKYVTALQYGWILYSALERAATHAGLAKSIAVENVANLPELLALIDAVAGIDGWAIQSEVAAAVGLDDGEIQRWWKRLEEDPRHVRSKTLGRNRLLFVPDVAKLGVKIDYSKIIQWFR